MSKLPIAYYIYNDILFEHLPILIKINIRIGEYDLRLWMVNMIWDYIVNMYLYWIYVDYLEGQPHHPVNLIGTVGIDMEDGSVDSLGNFGAVESCAGVNGSGGEAYLVIADDMDDASWFIVCEILKLKTFIDYSLACEGCVSVDDDPERLAPLGIPREVLDRLHSPVHHRVHSLQMARVRQNSQFHLLPALSIK